MVWVIYGSDGVLGAWGFIWQSIGHVTCLDPFWVCVKSIHVSWWGSICWGWSAHQIMKFSSRGYSSLVESFTAVKVFSSEIRYDFISILERQHRRVRSIVQLWWSYLQSVTPKVLPSYTRWEWGESCYLWKSTGWSAVVAGQNTCVGRRTRIMVQWTWNRTSRPPLLPYMKLARSRCSRVMVSEVSQNYSTSFI